MVNLRIIKNVYKTLHEMLNDRKYKIKYNNFTDEEMLNLYNTENCKVECLSGDRKLLAVIYDSENYQKISLDNIKKIINTHDLIENKNKITNFILIINTKLTYRGEKEIYQLKNIDSEIFYFDDLHYNIMNHELQPKFKLLTDKECEKVKNTYKKTRLPFIKSTDKVTKYFNAKLGDVFEIYRNDGSIYYRTVVK